MTLFNVSSLCFLRASSLSVRPHRRGAWLAVAAQLPPRPLEGAHSVPRGTELSQRVLRIQEGQGGWPRKNTHRRLRVTYFPSWSDQLPHPIDVFTWDLRVYFAFSCLTLGRCRLCQKSEPVNMSEPAVADTRRLNSKPQDLTDAYGPPSNFLEIDVYDPQIVGVGRNRYTTYEVRMRVSGGTANPNRSLCRLALRC